VQSMFNLINEQWIRVICKSGKTRKITPWEISDKTDPPVKLAFARPDFNSAVTQFLIGLVQTTYPLKDDDAWLDVLETPISAEELKKSMGTVAQYFELSGSEHSFMQEKGLATPKNAKDILSILLTTPGENTLKQNKDFFIKRTGSRGCLCKSCTAAAIYTLQALAPVGGAGYRCSIRGSSPLTTMVEGPDLYSTVLLNVLPTNHVQNTNANKQVFPWALGKIASLPPSNNNWNMVYWTTERRIELGEEIDGICSVCGEETRGFASYHEINNGTEYKSWEHPLCPYYLKKDELIPAPVKEDINHLNQWTYMVYEDVSETVPAKSIRHLHSNRTDIQEILGENQFRIWISGYQNKQALPISWKEMHQPILLDYSDKEKASFMLTIRKTIALVMMGYSDMQLAFNRLLGKRISDNSEKKQGLPQSKPVPPTIAEEYWNRCDMMFRQHLSEMEHAELDTFLTERMEDLKKIVLQIVDGYSDTLPLDYYSNVVEARRIVIKRMSVKSMSERIKK